MNAAEEWLEMNTGYCVRLSARIRPAQCEINRNEHISCQGCEGLDMGKVKYKHPRCSVEGCDRQAWKGGMCYKHYHNHHAKVSQVEPKASQKNLGIQNQEALDELAEALPEVPGMTPAAQPAANPLLPPPIAPTRPGIFIDFSGQEDLMRWLFDMCGDTDASVAVLGLLKARKEGLLRMDVA